MSAATVTAAGPGWLVEWEHDDDGPQMYYTRDEAKAQCVAAAVNEVKA
jgi:hypothetical protein